MKHQLLIGCMIITSLLLNHSTTLRGMNNTQKISKHKVSDLLFIAHNIQEMPLVNAIETINKLPPKQREIVMDICTVFRTSYKKAKLNRITQRYEPSSDFDPEVRDRIQRIIVTVNKNGIIHFFHKELPKVALYSHTPSSMALNPEIIKQGQNIVVTGFDDYCRTQETGYIYSIPTFLAYLYHHKDIRKNPLSLFLAITFKKSTQNTY